MFVVVWELGGDEVFIIDCYVFYYYVGIIVNENVLFDGGDLIVLLFVMFVMVYGCKYCENFKGNGFLRVVDIEVGIKVFGFCLNSSVVCCCN